MRLNARAYTACTYSIKEYVRLLCAYIYTVKILLERSFMISYSLYMEGTLLQNIQVYNVFNKLRKDTGHKNTSVQSLSNLSFSAVDMEAYP